MEEGELVEECSCRYYGGWGWRCCVWYGGGGIDQVGENGRGRQAR